MSTWTNSGDGQRRTDPRVTHRLSVEDLARLLAWAEDHHGAYLDAATPCLLKAVRNEVREALEDYGQSVGVDYEPTDRHRDLVRRAFGAW